VDGLDRHAPLLGISRRTRHWLCSPRARASSEATFDEIIETIGPLAGKRVHAQMRTHFGPTVPRSI
jgi:hypothetical protein